MSRDISSSLGLPPWAEEIRRVFRGGTVSQFVLHGNVHDLVRLDEPGEKVQYLSLKRFIDEVLFAPFEAVVHYDRANGITIGRGAAPIRDFLRSFDQWNGTSYATAPQTIPRDPKTAFVLLDRFVRYAVSRTRVVDDTVQNHPMRLAVVLDFAQFIAPRGGALQLAGAYSEAIIQLLDWAHDPALLGADVAIVLVTENVTDLATELIESPNTATVGLPLPDAKAIAAYLGELGSKFPDLGERTDLSTEVLADRLRGLSLVAVRNLVSRAVRNREPLGEKQLRKLKRQIIEKECADLLEFIESDRTLDDVAGHTAVKQWLREDTSLLRAGRTDSLPMGYLLCGRIGTGKTYLATCWAGEIGIPCVVLKNFRDKWLGSTEGNLEKIFTVLHALGQVLVFVDEADQMTGSRGTDHGDSGVSGRVYGMLAKEMSNTRNRGHIIWVFATSRPDMLEVDLKRPGRLDIHIPLFPPQNAQERADLMAAMARKLGLDLDPAELPELPADLMVGGNELEAVLVRARRVRDLEEVAADRGDADAESARPLPEVIAQTLAEFRPSAHVDHLSYMDLLAVKECTDARFLPAPYRGLSRQEIERQLTEIRARTSL